MIRRTIFGVSAVTMLMLTPTASAGYWTGHAEVIRTIIENWILNHTRTTGDVSVTAPDKTSPALNGAAGARGISTPAQPVERSRR